MDGHPLKDTHYLVVDSIDEYVVPNLVGETLPRKDKGDKEDYCATMLTLFRPWRSGLDLKQQGESWEDAFQKHRIYRRSASINEELQFEIRMFR